MSQTQDNKYLIICLAKCRDNSVLQIEGSSKNARFSSFRAHFGYMQNLYGKKLYSKYII